MAGGPVLSTPRGAPALPAGVAGSISHKPTLAIALATRLGIGEATTLGIDLEIDRVPRVDVSRYVLTVVERARVDLLTPAARSRAVLTVFAAKEATYKALDPWLRRFVSFAEVEIVGLPDGPLAATFAARAGEGRFSVELHEVPLDGFIIVAARVRPTD